MDLLKPTQDKRSMLEKVRQALALMQPTDIQETDDGRFFVTLLPTSPYYKLEDPLSVAVEMLQRAKLKPIPGYQSKTEERVLFDLRCEDTSTQKRKRGEKLKNA